MVDFTDHGFRDCAPDDDGDGAVCPLCAFKAAVEGLVDHMQNVAQLWYQLMRERNEPDAFQRYDTLLTDIEMLRRVVMDDDDRGDE
jgi:hypothetical protein